MCVYIYIYCVYLYIVCIYIYTIKIMCAQSLSKPSGSSLHQQAKAVAAATKPAVALLSKNESGVLSCACPRVAY